MEAERVRLLDEEQAYRNTAAAPLAEAWGECRTLAAALAAGGADARVRLAGLLRRTLIGVRVLVADRPGFRLAAVRIGFVGSDQHRDDLSVYRMPRGSKRPAAWWARSFAGTGGLDLRDPEGVRQADGLLARLDLDPLTRDPGNRS